MQKNTTTFSLEESEQKKEEGEKKKEKRDQKQTAKTSAEGG